jgi:tetratricopeptide (TPR) repeat protein
VDPPPDPAAAVARIEMRVGGEVVNSSAAFWISPDVAATTWHTLLASSPEGSWSLRMTDGSVHTVKTVVGVDERADIALVRAEPPFAGAPLRLASGLPAPGQTIRSICSPLETTPCTREGMVVRAGEIGFYGPSIIVELTDGIPLGWSGSPILDDHDAVLGVAHLGAAAKVLGVPASAVAALREAHPGVGTPLAQWSPDPQTRFGASMQLFMAAGQRWAHPPEESEAMYREAVRISGDFWPAWGMLGDIYLTRNDTAGAADAFGRAAANSPLAKDGLDLAGVYLRLNRPDESVAAGTRAREIDPQGFKSEMRERAALDLMRDEKYEEALPSMLLAMRGKPYDDAARVNYAQCLAMTGKNEEALPYLDGVLEKDPDNSYALHGRGMVLARLGRDDEAIASFLAALSRDPKSAASMKLLGEAYVRKGRIEEAEAILVTLRSLHPGQAERLQAAIAKARDGR